ncbi:uncharacterized protein LOC105630983 isoform X2 [Jatropha curcas]|uniref:uncharacterized protein LOC105630983 isoform X2 n=1 Tax=Jatropha curcas TaxID=180498 RepID=UPI0005FADD5E|nr:uncharacterized protein LOC105630983 isoform X2 [Jatropha curcas]
MECCRRANRSDIHLPMEEEAKIEEETRDYFDGMAPKRHTKPSRSEHSAQYVDVLLPHQNSIPELLQFQSLQTESESQEIIHNGKGEIGEEFVETEYYSDLNCIDKQHHTTGTGFIKTGNANGKCFSIAPDSVTSCHTSCQGNPATNDWIPAAANSFDCFKQA